MLRVRVRGKAATALQLMPRDLLDDYDKIKNELLLRLADKEPRRSSNVATLINGCPRQPNESIEQFGTRVQKLVRDAMDPQCPLSQVNELAKSYFTRWLNDKQLIPSLLDQADHKEFRYLVDHAAKLTRSLDLHEAKSGDATPAASTATSQGKKREPYTRSPSKQGNGYNAYTGPPPNCNQPRNTGPSAQGNGTGYNQNAQQTWVKEAQGNFRNSTASNPNNARSTPSNSVAAHQASASGTSIFLDQHRNKYSSFAPSTGQTHNTLSATLPISTLSTRVAGPCAIGPVPKKDIRVEGMPAVSLWDSGAPVSIMEAGYLRGLLEAKGVNPRTWPIDPPSTAITVANGHSLNCGGSTILQVSIGGESKPVRVQLTGDDLSYPVIIGTNAFADLGIELVRKESGVNVLQPESVCMLSIAPDILAAKVDLCALTTLKPFAQRVYPVRVTAPDGDYLFIQSIGMADEQVVTVQKGIARVRIINWADEPLVWDTAMAVGKFEKVELCSCEDVIAGETFEPAENPAKISAVDASLKPPTDPAERMRAIWAACKGDESKCSESQRLELRELIREYPDCFALHTCEFTCEAQTSSRFTSSSRKRRQFESPSVPFHGPFVVL